MINRRTFLCGLITLSSPLVTEAQPAGKIPRIGVVAPGTPAPGSLPLQVFDAFREGLRNLGYVEGGTVVLETRWSRPEQYASFVRDLVQLNVDVILAGTTPASVAAKQWTSTIPIVMAATGGDPVALGLAASLGHPGGNVTGLTLQTHELPGKRLELLRDTVPRVSRVALFWHSMPPAMAEVKDHEAAAQSLGIRLQPLQVSGPEDFDAAFHGALQGRVQALMMIQSALYATHRARIAELALRNRLPTISGETGYAQAGGLMNYGPNIPESWRRAAWYVDRILKGAKPGDLPIEQPTKFELVINLKTAKALGLTIPQSILVRADEIIQ